MTKQLDFKLSVSQWLIFFGFPLSQVILVIQVSQLVPVIPVSQVILVSPVSPVSLVSPVRLAHLWVDFQVVPLKTIFCAFPSCKYDNQSLFLPTFVRHFWKKFELLQPIMMLNKGNWNFVKLWHCSENWDVNIPNLLSKYPDVLQTFWVKLKNSY